MSPKYYIGTSGWVYPHWRRVFYPSTLAQSKWLQFYATTFATVELNNSFYHLTTEKAFARWYDTSPEGFIFAVKVSRYITHVKRLKEVTEPVSTFLSRAANLKEKLGPLLYQLPPNMHRNYESLDSFLRQLPPQHRHVIEFRHKSWLDEPVFGILRRHNAGLCVFDMPDLTCPLVATSNFAYIRFHGATGLYSSNYSDRELGGWAKRIAALGRDLQAVYIYFNNDAEGFALRNALTLR
jgi:uncharacterized protein YecE (DUF72 family)